MMFKTHMAFAVFIGLLLLYYLRPSSPILFSALFLLSAVLPDIDTSKSKVGRKTRPLSNVLNLLFSHRGFLHTLWIPIMGYALLWYSGFQFFGFAFFSGYTLHLICDTFTVEGLRLFHPVWKRHFRGFMRTGGIMEHFVLLAVCISIGLLVINISGLV